MNRRSLLLILVTAVITVLVAGFALCLATPNDPSLPLVIIVYGGEKGDLSFIDSASRGLSAAREKIAFKSLEFTSLEYDTIKGLLQNESPEKPVLVITASFAYANAPKQLATEYPGFLFLGIDQTGPGRENLRTCEITSYGSSYLAGVLASNATRTRHVGIILGTHSDVIEGFRLGFRDGILAVDPSITITEQYVREDSVTGFSDPVRAQEIAREMYSEGVDIIYTVAGYSGMGAIDEAKLAPGRYIIGVDRDQSDLGPDVILASAVKHVDRAVESGIRDFMGGTFTGGKQIVGLKEGATDLVFNPKFSEYKETVSHWREKAEEEEARYLAERKGV